MAPAVQVLIIHGRHDRLIPVQNSQRLASLLPHAQLEVIECGHNPHEECPELFVNLVHSFLESLEPGKSHADYTITANAGL